MEKDLVIIRNLADYSFEAEQAYKGSLSLAYAVSEAQRLKDMADKKAAWEAEQARRQQEAQQTAETAPKTDFTEKHEQTPYEAPKREWVAFKALLNPSEALELKRFFREKGITFTTIE